jgi:drug/metabolite transporter (DMT)-like permease
MGSKLNIEFSRRQLKNLHIHLALVLVSILFGINYVVGKYLLFQIGPAAWTFVRPALTAVILAALVAPSLFKVNRRQWAKIGVAGLFGVVFNQVFYFEGLYRTTVIHTVVINTTVPIFTLLFSVVLKYEKMNLWRAMGMTLGVIGVLIVLEVERLQLSSRFLLGDTLILMNCLSFSLYLVLSKPINREVPPLTVTAGMFLIGSILIGVYGGPAAAHISWTHFGPIVYGCIAFSVIGGTIGTYFLNNWALSRVDSSAVAIYIYIQPLVAGILSHFLFNETLSARMLIATILVFSGVAVATLMPMKKKKEGIYVETHS